MIVERTEHPSWLSNAYLVADGPGGHGVLIDGNGVVDPLLERIERATASPSRTSSTRTTTAITSSTTSATSSASACRSWRIR